MNTPEYVKNLTPVERAAAIKLGAFMSLAHNGITVQEFQKKAANWTGALTPIPRSILMLSILGGIPLGALAHAMGKSISTDDRKEREALARLKYFQQLTAGMEQGLTEPKEEEPQAAVM